MMMTTRSKFAIIFTACSALLAFGANAQVDSNQAQPSWQQDNSSSQDSNQQSNQQQNQQPAQVQDQQAENQPEQNQVTGTGEAQIIAFEFDSAEIAAEEAAKLKGIIETVKEEGETPMVKVVGYTDTSGPEAYNQYLAQQRAEAVKNYLGSL